MSEIRFDGAQAPPRDAAGLVFLVGGEIDPAPFLAAGLRCVSIDHASRSRELIENAGPALVITGPDVSASESIACLTAISTNHPRPRHLGIVTRAGDDLAPFESLVSSDVIFYLSRSPPEADALVALALAAFGIRSAARSDFGPLTLGERSAYLRRARACAQAIASADTASRLASAMENAARQIVAADQVVCSFFDPDRDTLAADFEQTSRVESSASGLAGFVVRVGAPLCTADAAADPRFDPQIDCPGRATARAWVGVPLTAPSGDVAGVLVAMRAHERTPFSDAEFASLSFLVELAAPHVHQLALMRHADADAMSSANSAFSQVDLFRAEALASYAAQSESRPAVLKLQARWTAWAYWLVLCAVAAFLIFAAVGTVNEYASGPAVIDAAGCTELCAVEPGVVEELAVAPGERVPAGATLVRLHEAAEVAEYERSTSRFDIELVRYFRTPGDPEVRDRLSEVRVQRDFARARLEGRSMKAPHRGFVGDLHVRPGQKVDRGDRLMSLCDDQARFSVVALLPGSYRPQLQKNMPLTIELDGYEHSRQQLTIDQVGTDVIDAVAAWRYVGHEPNAQAQLAEPVVLMKSQLAGLSFSHGGHTYHYHEGLRGRVEVPVRRESILVALFPALKYFSEGSR